MKVPGEKAHNGQQSRVNTESVHCMVYVYMVVGIVLGGRSLGDVGHDLLVDESCIGAK